jgi:hypothetical protein
MWPLVVLIAQLTAAQVDAAKAAYHALGAKAVEAHQAAGKPPADAQKIDVSARFRSASFGHTTWLWVTPDGGRFWIEYGASTNRPGGLYGPFAVAAPKTK